jgi:hypothetical protein
MKNDLGLSKGLLSSVSNLLNDSSKLKAEEAKADHERLAAHVKPGSMRPLSMEEAKVASYAAKAPERRVSDTITQLYTQSVADHNAKAQAEAAVIKNAYAARGGVHPVMEAELSPKQKKLAAVAGDKSKIDAMDLHVLRSRKTAQVGSVSDEKILDGDTIEELKDTPGNTAHQCAIHVKHATMGEGRTLTSQHAQPDTEGEISWYTVMFEHGIEKVDTKDLEVLVSESHMSHKPMKKKKM